MEINHLRNKVGNEVNWYNQGLSMDETFEVLTEFEVDGNPYAVVHPRETEDGPYIFKYSLPEDGTHHLSPIDDDDEWELAAEAFDRWLHEYHRNSPIQ